jgi:hypothetical protein
VEVKKKKSDSEFLSYNLMLNSGKKNCASRDKKNKYSNSTYRSYKNVDHEKYVEDLEKIDYVNIGNESDINSAYDIFEIFYLEVVLINISQ